MLDKAAFAPCRFGCVGKRLALMAIRVLLTGFDFRWGGGGGGGRGKGGLGKGWRGDYLYYDGWGGGVVVYGEGDGEGARVRVRVGEWMTHTCCVPISFIIRYHAMQRIMHHACIHASFTKNQANASLRATIQSILISPIPMFRRIIVISPIPMFRRIIVISPIPMFRPIIVNGIDTLAFYLRFQGRWESNRIESNRGRIGALRVYSKFGTMGVAEVCYALVVSGGGWGGRSWVMFGWLRWDCVLGLRRMCVCVCVCV